VRAYTLYFKRLSQAQVATEVLDKLLTKKQEHQEVFMTRWLNLECCLRYMSGGFIN